MVVRLLLFMLCSLPVAGAKSAALPDLSALSKLAQEVTQRYAALAYLEEADDKQAQALESITAGVNYLRKLPEKYHTIKGQAWKESAEVQALREKSRRYAPIDRLIKVVEKYMDAQMLPADKAGDAWLMTAEGKAFWQQSVRSMLDASDGVFFRNSKAMKAEWPAA